MGKELYGNGEYKESIIKFLEALTAADEATQKSEIYLNVSLSYYSIGDTLSCKTFLEKLFQIQPDIKINELTYPQSFVELFSKYKSEFAGAKIQDIDKEPEKEEPKVKTKPAEEQELKKKKGKSGLLIIAGLAVAGGIVAALLAGGKRSKGNEGAESVPTVGTIQVNSSPLGAKVFLNGIDTGQITNCTLTYVSAGTHTVTLVLENYLENDTTVNVVGGQTSIVDRNLFKHTIIVNNPTGETKWTKGDPVEIKWEVDTEGKIRARLKSNVSQIAQLTVPRTVSPNTRLGTTRSNSRVHISSRERGTKRASLEKNGLNLSTETSPRQVGSRTLHRIIPMIPKHSGNAFIRNKADQAIRIQEKLQLQLLSVVKVELYKDDNLDLVIAPQTENDGLFSWTVAAEESGPDYRIKVRSASDPGLLGESDEFEILNIGDFDEHFDDASFANANLSKSYPALWKVADGVYRSVGQEGLNQRHYSYYKTRSYSDFIFEALCGNEDTEIFSGIGFRGNADFTAYYFFYVGTAGEYGLKRRENNKETYLINWTHHPSIKQGTHVWNHLRVEAIGKRFVFSINDVEVDSITINEAPSHGYVALITRTNYFNVLFDDLKMRVIN